MQVRNPAIIQRDESKDDAMETTLEHRSGGASELRLRHLSDAAAIIREVAVEDWPAAYLPY